MNMLALQLHPMFRSLSDDARAQVLKLMVTRTVEPGTVIMKQGEAGDDMFVLKRGTCAVHVRGKTTSNDCHGDEVATLTEPDFFGDVALTQANALRTVSSFAPRHLFFSFHNFTVSHQCRSNCVKPGHHYFENSMRVAWIFS